MSPLRTANVLLRGLLEFVGLVALSYGAWVLLAGTGLLRFVGAVGLSLSAAALWAVFRVPGDDWDTETFGADPREPTVPVSGPVRLGVEALLFGGAVALLVLTGQVFLGGVFGILVLLHYTLAYDRVRWLLRASA